MVLCILILALFLGSDPVIAMDVVAAKFVVNRANAQRYNVNVRVTTASPLCGRAEDVYVSFSNEFRESEFKHINVSIRKGDSLLFDVSPVLLENNDHQNGVEPFLGSVMCVDRSLLPHVTISVAYGKGELVTSILEISGLEEFENRE